MLKVTIVEKFMHFKVLYFVRTSAGMSGCLILICYHCTAAESTVCQFTTIVLVKLTLLKALG